MKISAQLKKAALTNDQNMDIGVIKARLPTIEEEVKEAYHALEKYKSDPQRYAPQKDNLQNALRNIMKTAKVLLSFVEKI
jgi:5'-deoxynucleotidase YfbR-like HD superfamily hydrolase